MRPLSWTAGGYREVIGALRARHVELAWALADFVSRSTGIPEAELVRRAWARALGITYRRTCCVGDCVQTALRGQPWCERCRPGLERRPASLSVPLGWSLQMRPMRVPSGPPKRLVLPKAEPAIPDRAYACERYAACLARAARRNQTSWTCSSCELAGSAPSTTARPHLGGGEVERRGNPAWRAA